MNRIADYITEDIFEDIQKKNNNKQTNINQNKTKQNQNQTKQKKKKTKKKKTTKKNKNKKKKKKKTTTKKRISSFRSNVSSFQEILPHRIYIQLMLSYVKLEPYKHINKILKKKKKKNRIKGPAASNQKDP